MGCAASKRIDVAADVYRPPPTSFAVFDISAIEEPWLMVDNTQPEHQEKPTHVPAQILEKLAKFEADTPHSWDEVSKALGDLKPKPTPTSPKAQQLQPPPPPLPEISSNKKKHSKSVSFHTVEELDAKLSSKPAELEKKKTESTRTEPKMKTESRVVVEPQTESGGYNYKPVKQNIFLLKDRLEREKEGKLASYDRIMSKRDPLSEFPEKCPPGGADSVVIYTTSLRGVRRTYEDCNRARAILENHQVVFDERDVSLHGEFLSELREVVGEAAVPRVFVKGRYLGGAEEVAELNETGKLGKVLRAAAVERGVGRQACEGCGGLRFVPCLECGGSCKVLNGDKKERCCKCNENGLVHCPLCV